MAGRPRLLALSAAVAITATMAGCGPSPTKTTEDGALMILIPAGEFPMGGKPDEVAGMPDGGLLTYLAERPVHRVQVSAFYIDKNEVTTAQYRRFLEAIEGGDRQWDHADQPADVDHQQRYLTDVLSGDDQPAVGLNWYDAYAYCGWAGKRLPTEAEWERAARGGEYRKFPWGEDDPNTDGLWFANYRPAEGADADGYRASAPVGSFADGVSPYGVMDMAGNAEEWVQDWYGVNSYRLTEGAQDPTGPVQGDRKVIKGGSYEAPVHQIRVAMRLYGKPRDKGPRLGVRCAMAP